MMKSAMRAIVAAAVVAVAGTVGASSVHAEETPSPAADRYETTDVSTARPWKREAVVAIELEAVGLGDDRRSELDEPGSCADFKPTAIEVRDWIARARVLSKRAFLEETDWSACHAVGTVRFRGGAAGRWVARRGGAGVVTIEDRPHYVACARCRLARR